jgi:hypothetical protein
MDVGLAVRLFLRLRDIEAREPKLGQWSPLPIEAAMS